MNPATQGLAGELEHKRRALSLRCIDGMYEDPFWMARFGERGRRHAEQDSEFHVKYIVAALRAEDAAVFENYARWLRGVLAARGMCSWHLAESFRQLALAVGEEHVTNPEPALALLSSGTAALAYTTGDAASLAARGSELLLIREELAHGDYRLDELWSFLLDALDRADVSEFRAHVDFLRSTLAAEDAERERLERTLRELQRRSVMLAPLPLAERLAAAFA